MSFRDAGEYADDIVLIKEGLVTIATEIGLSAAAMRSAVVSTFCGSGREGSPFWSSRRNGVVG